jgi:hypothetical protein
LEKDVIAPIKELFINPNFEDAIGGNEDKIRKYDLIRSIVQEKATLEKTNEHKVSSLTTYPPLFFNPCHYAVVNYVSDAE